MTHEHANGSLRCYNQFSRHYENSDEMKKQLEDIAKMKFNAVWVGPLHTVGNHKKASGEFGSIYAMANAWHWRDDFFKTPDVDKQKEMIQAYTAEAKRVGLIPMFDLVLKHMAKDSILARGEDSYLRDHLHIDTRKWFKNEVTKIGSQVWDDVVPFNYDDPKICEEIIDYLWKPFIRMYIDKMHDKDGNLVEGLGFEGVRIDAAQHVPAHVVKDLMHYAKRLWHEKGAKKPLIFAEVLGSKREQRDHLRWHDLHDEGISHITNYANWLPNRHEPPRKDEQGRLLEPDCRKMKMEEFKKHFAEEKKGKDHERGEALHVVRLTPKDHIRNPAVGGTIGFADFHDEQSLARRLIDYGVSDPVEIEKAMREKIATAAFYSDAGWLVSTGFEDADSRRRSVFDCDDNRQKKQRNADMRPFITEINEIIEKQPALGLFNHSERLFLDEKPDLVIFKTCNNKDEHDQNPPTYLKIANINPTQKVILKKHEIDKLARMSGKRHADDFDGIYLCGGVEIEGHERLPGANQVIRSGSNGAATRAR